MEFLLLLEVVALLQKFVLVCSFSLFVVLTIQHSVSANSVDDLSADLDQVDNAADKADDIGAGVLVFTTGASIMKKLARSV